VAPKGAVLVFEEASALYFLVMVVSVDAANLAFRGFFLV